MSVDVNVAIIGRNAECEALSDLLDGGYFEVRTGTQPTSVADAATGTLIGTVTLNTPSFATASGGAMALDPPSNVTAVADADVNNITWGRFYTSGAAAVIDVDISLSGGGAAMIATKIDPLTGESIALTYTHTIPE